MLGSEMPTELFVIKNISNSILIRLEHRLKTIRVAYRRIFTELNLDLEGRWL